MRITNYARPYLVRGEALAMLGETARAAATYRSTLARWNDPTVDQGHPSFLRALHICGFLMPDEQVVTYRTPDRAVE